MILITGATGTTGREIVKQLSVAGAQVRALVRHPEKASALEGPGVELVTGDLDQPETLDAALKDVACALLLPANTPRQVEQERHFIEAAKRVHTPHVVKYSAFGAHVSSTARISQRHGQSEQYLEESGVPFTHVQPNFFMQNMLWFASAIASQGAFYLPMQDAAVSMVDTRDIAAVVTIVLTTPGHVGKIYTITGPEALSFHVVAEKLSTTLGKQVRYGDVSPEHFKRTLIEGGQPEWYADALNELFQGIREGQYAVVTRVVADVARKPPIAFDQFAQDYAPVFQGTGR
jgi:uncharacterized protein YbjT (DUF2867 family)